MKLFAKKYSIRFGVAYRNLEQKQFLKIKLIRQFTVIDGVLVR
jgi:hypothetical protein